jgi:hypothetical protein
LTIALLAIVLLLVVRSGAAQGTSRAFPRPMSFDEAADVLGPLGLSEAQRTAVGFEHGQYLDGFRMLREGTIETYLADVGAYPLDYRDDRDEIIDGMKRHRAILREIEQLEARFFAAVETVLSDEQKAMLPRLAARRERWRLSMNPSSQGWELPSLRRVDLVRTLDDLDLLEDARAEIDALVAKYESSLTPAFRKIHGDRLDLPLAFHDRTIEARRAFEERMEALKSRFDLETEEGQKKYAEAVTTALQENPVGFQASGSQLPEQVEIRRQFVRVSRLDRRLLADLRRLLEPADADRLERRVSRRAYGMLGIPGDPVLPRVMKHIEDEQTTPELRAALEQLHAGYRGSRSTLIDRLIAAAEDAQFTGPALNVFHFTFGGEPKQPEESNPVAEQRQAIRDLNDRTLKSYAELTGEEITAHQSRGIELPGIEGGAIIFEAGEGASVTIEADGEPTEGVVGVMVVAEAVDDLEGGTISSIVVGGADLWVGDEAEMGVDSGHDHVEPPGAGGMHAPRGWLPGPMAEDFMNRLAADLGLDDDTRPMLDALYADYRDAFQTLDAQVVGPARAAGRRVMQFGFTHDDEAAEQIEPAEAFDRIRNAMAAIARLDRQLFDDLAVVIAGPDTAPIIDRARRARSRKAHEQVGDGGLFDGLSSGSREDRVDLIALSVSESAHFDQGDRLASRDALGAYDLESEALYTERWDASLESARHSAERLQEAVRRSSENQMIMMTNVSGESADSPAGAARRRVASARAGLRALNQRSLPLLADKLSVTAYAAIRDAYQRKAFPTVFRDRSSLEPIVRRALALELPVDQRTATEGLCLDYRSTYAGICERMIERIRAFDRQREPSGGPGGMTESRFKRYEELQRDLEVDRFERRNLSERTRQGLREILGETNATQVGLKGPDN